MDTQLQKIDSQLVKVETLPADRQPAAIYIASLAPGSRRAMIGALNTIAGMVGHDVQSMDWASVRFQHASAIRAKLAEKFAPATVNKTLSALKGVLKAAWRLGLIPTEEYQRAIDLPAIKGHTLPRGRSLSIGEIKALIDACKADTTATGARDAALIAVSYSCGLRRSEVVALQLADYNQESGEIKVLSGKGGKDRTAYATNGTSKALAAWLEVRGNEPGALFLPIRKGGKIVNHQMDNQSAYDILAKRAKQAGITEVSPHDFRRTFVGDLLDNGVDISTVQQLAGHAVVTTTQRYDRRPERVKQQAAATLHVPF